MNWRFTICTLAVLALTACGGGDKASSNSTPSTGSGNTSTASGGSTSSGGESNGEATLAAAYNIPISTIAANENLKAAAEATHLPALAANSASPVQIMAAPAGSPADPPVSAAAVVTAANVATALSGSRGVYASFHDNVAPLLPESSLVTAQSSTARALQVAPDGLADVNKKIEDERNVVNPQPIECPDVKCATAEVEAKAEAVAGAFAWASARACAWAQAMACVYSNIAPFNRVCAWAKSTACVSTFTTAFAVGYAFNTEKKVLTVCSDGFTKVQVLSSNANAMANR